MIRKRFALGIDFDTEAGRTAPNDVRGCASQPFYDVPAQRKFTLVLRHVGIHHRLFKEYIRSHDYFGRGANDVR